MPDLWLPRDAMAYAPPAGAVLRLNTEHALAPHLEAFFWMTGPDFQEVVRKYEPSTLVDPTGQILGESSFCFADVPAAGGPVLGNRQAPGTSNAATAWITGPSIPTTDQLTIATRLYTSSTASAQTILCQDNNTTRGYLFTLAALYGSNKLVFFQNGGSFPYDSTAARDNTAVALVSVPFLSWFNAACVRDGRTAKVYQDGLDVTSLAGGLPTDWTVAPNAQLVPWLVFKRNYPLFEDPFAGGMQYLAYFSKGLTQDELTTFQAAPWELLTY